MKKDTLGPKDIQFMTLLSEGFTRKQIAGIMNKGYYGVIHLSHRCVSILGAETIEHALAIAIRKGVIQ